MKNIKERPAGNKAGIAATDWGATKARGDHSGQPAPARTEADLPASMDAIMYAEYGGPDVLTFQTVDRPTPGDDEVLIDVHAASLNKGDWHLMQGTPVFIRFLYGGLLKPDISILGMDVAGTVRAVGTDVTAFRPGDEVMGNVSESGHGGFAEYVCAPPEALVSKPSDVSFVDAAAVPTAAVTALQGLRDDGGIRSGDDVLVHGASGGVGTFAVQLAASFGAKVTGVCSTQKGETVRSIGADRVVDYTSEDVTAGDRQYDLILDSAAAHSIRAYSRVLREGGRYVMVGGPAGRFVKVQLFGPLFSRILQKQIGPFEMEVSGTDLAAIADHLGAGILTPVVDRTFPLEETPAAMRYLEAGRACGKIVIVMNDDPGG